MSEPARIRLALEYMAEALDDLETLTRGRTRSDYLEDRIAQRAAASAASR